jgi:hypothetical protein
VLVILAPRTPSRHVSKTFNGLVVGVAFAMIENFPRNTHTG